MDYLATTPPELLATVENVLAVYDSSRGRGTMAGDAAGLMNPAVSRAGRAGRSSAGPCGKTAQPLPVFPTSDRPSLSAPLLPPSTQVIERLRDVQKLIRRRHM